MNFPIKEKIIRQICYFIDCDLTNDSGKNQQRKSEKELIDTLDPINIMF